MCKRRNFRIFAPSFEVRPAMGKAGVFRATLYYFGGSVSAAKVKERPFRCCKIAGEEEEVGVGQNRNSKIIAKWYIVRESDINKSCDPTYDKLVYLKKIDLAPPFGSRSISSTQNVFLLKI